ncbi:hypothetical protein [Streptomyces sp. NPDC058252]|uniref:hypothetical protein n=1 Tax=Streptomyces sp. NPDC058252 TaxID=3346405 RepID=UPI0036E96ACD
MARIDHFQLTNTLEKIEKINARAEKKGLSGRLDLDVTEVEVKSKDDMGFEVVEIMYDVEFTGEAPKHNGWVFLATLDWDENAGLIVRTAPGVHSVDREGLREGACDHCNKDRMRRETFLVKNEETGEEKQIGRSCIKDFLGWDTGISWPSTPADDDEEKEFYGFGGGDRSVSTETVLAYAWACVKAFGFVRSQDYHATPTVRLVRNAINPGKGRRDKEFAEAMRPLAAEAKEKAAEIRAFILSDDFSGTSEYVLNLKAIAGGKAVSPRNFGILVSAPQAWARFNEQTLIRKARSEKPSEWIGTAPDKDKGIKGSRITFTGMIESIRYIDGLYGATTLYQVRDELSGVIVKWFASNNALGENTGVRVTLRGTVKEHDEYKDVKATVLTRCTLVETAVPEPKPYEIDAPKKPRTPRKKATPSPSTVVEEIPAELVEDARRIGAAVDAEMAAKHDEEMREAKEEAQRLFDAAYPAPVVEVVEEAQEVPETVQEDPQPEPQPEPDRTSGQTPSGLSSETESDSPAQAETDPLAYFAGGYKAVARTLADDAAHYQRICRLAHERYMWVRLGDDVQRMPLAEAYDLLGQAYAEGATWAADLVPGPQWSAARWEGLALVVGRDGEAATV